MLPQDFHDKLILKNNNHFIFEMVAHQIKKDWERSGLWEFSLTNINSPNDLFSKLNDHLTTLVNNQPESLQNLLYIMDLSELRMRFTSVSDSVENLTLEIIKREFLKVKLRIEIG